MAAKTFILVTVEPSQTRKVEDRLTGIPGAIVYEVLGPHDFIVDLEADTVEDITNVLQSKTRPIPGVSATVTCMVQAVGMSESGPSSG